MLSGDSQRPIDIVSFSYSFVMSNYVIDCLLFRSFNVYLVIASIEILCLVVFFYVLIISFQYDQSLFQSIKM